MSSIFSIFTLHTYKFYHIFIYTFTSTFCLPPCSSVSSTNISAALPLLKFWVWNFLIWIFFFFSCTGTFVHFFFFLLRFFLVYRMQIYFGFKNNFFFFFLSTNFMPTESWISVGIYWNTRNRTEWPKIFFKVE